MGLGFFVALCGGVVKHPVLIEFFFLNFVFIYFYMRICVRMRVCVYFLLDFSHFGIPNLYPLVSPHEYMFKRVKVTPLLTAEMYWSELTMDGIHKIVIREIRYFRIKYTYSN